MAKKFVDTYSLEKVKHFTVIHTSLITECGGLDWHTLHDHFSPDQSSKRKKKQEKQIKKQKAFSL